MHQPDSKARLFQTISQEEDSKGWREITACLFVFQFDEYDISQ
jgi:hypothetical protein